MVQALKREVIVEYLYRENAEGFWLDVHCDREPYAEMGPFATAAIRDAAKADLLETMRQMGEQDLPVFPQ